MRIVYNKHKCLILVIFYLFLKVRLNVKTAKFQFSMVKIHMKYWQTGIQTVSTKKFRQKYKLFHSFPSSWSWPISPRWCDHFAGQPRTEHRSLCGTPVLLCLIAFLGQFHCVRKANLKLRQYDLIPIVCLHTPENFWVILNTIQGTIKQKARPTKLKF